MRALHFFLPVFLALSAPLLAAEALKSGVFTPPRAAPAFTLQGSHDEPLTLAALRGKVVLLGFGFSSCREVCPITLNTLAQAHKQLGAQASELQVVYITVDPERDDAARLKQYLGHFNPTFIGGTGSPAELAAVRKEYGILAEKRANADGDYSHSSFVYLIDRKGLLRALMTYGHEPQDYVHDVRVLLSE